MSDRPTADRRTDRSTTHRLPASATTEPTRPMYEKLLTLESDSTVRVNTESGVFVEAAVTSVRDCGTDSTPGVSVWLESTQTGDVWNITAFVDDTPTLKAHSVGYDHKYESGEVDTIEVVESTDETAEPRIMTDGGVDIDETAGRNAVDETYHAMVCDDETDSVLETAAKVQDGDDVVMLMTPHNYQTHESMIRGTVTESPGRLARGVLADGDRAMADIRIETDDGRTFTWNIDNGYVIGHHYGLGRSSDIGRCKAVIPVSRIAESFDTDPNADESGRLMTDGGIPMADVQTAGGNAKTVVSIDETDGFDKFTLSLETGDGMIYRYTRLTDDEQWSHSETVKSDGTTMQDRRKAPKNVRLIVDEMNPEPEPTVAERKTTEVHLRNLAGSIIDDVNAHFGRLESDEPTSVRETIDRIVSQNAEIYARKLETGEYLESDDNAAERHTKARVTLEAMARRRMLKLRESPYFVESELDGETDGFETDDGRTVMTDGGRDLDRSDQWLSENPNGTTSPNAGADCEPVPEGYKDGALGLVKDDSHTDESEETATESDESAPTAIADGGKTAEPKEPEYRGNAFSEPYEPRFANEPACDAIRDRMARLLRIHNTADGLNQFDHHRYVAMAQTLRRLETERGTPSVPRIQWYLNREE